MATPGARRAAWFLDATLLAAALIGAAGVRSVAVDDAQVDAEWERSWVVTPEYPLGGKRVWQGWGVSLAWWANGFGRMEECASFLADLAFTLQADVPLQTKPARKGGRSNGRAESVPGLGLNIVRYNAGGSDRRKNKYGRMVEGTNFQALKGTFNARMMRGFWWDPKSPPSQWDWENDPGQLKMLRLAKERGADTFELFSNAPMWWMTLNHNTAGGECDYPIGPCISTTTNMNASMYDEFATYLTEIWSHAKDFWNVTFQTIEPFNEPSANWWHRDNHQEGCHWQARDQAAFVRVLYDMMVRKNMIGKVGISASDENTLSGNGVIMRKARSFVKARTAWTVLRNRGATEMISQANVHSYAWMYYNFGLRNSRLFRFEMNLDDGQTGNVDSIYVRKRFRSITYPKPLWMSEYGRGTMPRGHFAYPTDTKDYSGLQLARVIILDIKWLQPQAWAMWQLIDPSGSWGLIRGQPNEFTLETAQAGYYVFAQFTRHIRPGVQILHTQERNPPEGQHYEKDTSSHDPVDDDMTVVALDEIGRKVVVVAGPEWDQRGQHLNRILGDAARKLTVKLEKLPFKAGAHAKAWCTYTGDSMDFTDAELDRIDAEWVKRPRKYEKWRRSKYQRQDDIPLVDGSLVVMVPPFSVCTYEVPLVLE